MHWQYRANEKLYAAKLITHNMYETAKTELLKNIGPLEKICYCDKKDYIKAGNDNGFTENPAAAEQRQEYI